MSLELSVIIVCLFSIIFLVSVDWKKNKWLVLIFSVHALVTTGHLLMSQGYGIIPDNAYLFNVALVMPYFPALFLYTRDLILPSKSTSTNELIHFIPFGVIYILFIIASKNNPMTIIQQGTNSPIMIVFLVINIFLILFYGYRIYQLVQLNQSKYQEKYASNSPFMTLQWINWMMLLLIIFPITGATSYLFLDDISWETQILLVVISFLLGMLILAFFTFRQPTLYKEELLENLKKETKQEKKLIQKKAPITDKEATNSTNLAITDSEKQDYISKIEQYFKDAQPYLNPKIRMPELAQTLDIPRHIFSSVINEHYQMNFFNLINQYRVEYAKDLLKDKENETYTLETIGKMAGFNSRATFNRIFKLQTGQTPRAFQKEAH